MASIADDLTAAWLKQTFLLGVDLTLDDGSAYPDALYDASIEASIAWLEHELGILIDPVVITGERHDAFEQNRGAWWPFDLDHRPLISIDAIRIRYGSYSPVTLPVGWGVRVSDTHSKVHFIPSEESLGSYLFRAGVPIIAGDVFQPLEYIPGYFEFDYTAGHAQLNGAQSVADGIAVGSVVFATALPTAAYRVILSVAGSGAATPTVTVKSTTGFSFALGTPPTGGTATLTWRATTVPADIRQVIGYKAALLPLDVAGDLIAGAGVANKSVNMDGIGESLGTTASATNAGYGARVLQFERELKKLLPALRAKYRALNFGAF